MKVLVFPVRGELGARRGARGVGWEGGVGGEEEGQLLALPIVFANCRCTTSLEHHLDPQQTPLKSRTSHASSYSCHTPFIFAQ